MFCLKTPYRNTSHYLYAPTSNREHIESNISQIFNQQEHHRHQSTTNVRDFPIYRFQLHTNSTFYRMSHVQEIRDLLHALEEQLTTMRGYFLDNMNDQGPEQMQETVAEAINSSDPMDRHIVRFQEIRDDMNALIASQPERSDEATPAEGVTSNATTEPQSSTILGDDMQVALQNPTTNSVDSPDSSLPAVYFADYVISLRHHQTVTSEPTSMPTERENAIRELLSPVKSGVEELDPCFCGLPYADATAEIEKDSHEAVKMPECPHVFGKHCILKWLNENDPSTCPMCRKRVNVGTSHSALNREFRDALDWLSVAIEESWEMINSSNDIVEYA